MRAQRERYGKVWLVFAVVLAAMSALLVHRFVKDGTLSPLARLLGDLTVRYDSNDLIAEDPRTGSVVWKLPTPSGLELLPTSFKPRKQIIRAHTSHHLTNSRELGLTEKWAGSPNPKSRTEPIKAVSLGEGAE